MQYLDGVAGSQPKLVISRAVCEAKDAVLPRYLFEQVGGELRRLACNFEVTVVEFDSEVHSVYPFRRQL